MTSARDTIAYIGINLVNLIIYPGASLQKYFVYHFPIFDFAVTIKLPISPIDI